MISRSRDRFGPSFAARFRPRDCRGRREGRAPAGTRGPLCAGSAVENCTAAYRAAETSRPSLREWFDGLCRALPGAEFLWPPSPCEKMATRSRLARCRLPQGLTVATTVRTTRFCRTQHAPFVTRGRSSRGSAQSSARPAPDPCVPTRARVHRNSPTYRTTRDPSLVPGKLERYIRQFRISVKRYIFVILA
ncbi:hypothetical protein ABID59_002087 [Bradyrhizobium sp. S3.3.6]